MDVIPAVNDISMAPRVLSAPCVESASHSATYSGRVQLCRVEAVSNIGNRGYSSACILHNGRGGERRVQQIVHWGYSGTTTYLLLANASESLNDIFNVGDTMYVRRVGARPSRTRCFQAR